MGHIAGRGVAGPRPGRAMTLTTDELEGLAQRIADLVCDRLEERERELARTLDREAADAHRIVDALVHLGVARVDPDPVGPT